MNDASDIDEECEDDPIAALEAETRDPLTAPVRFSALKKIKCPALYLHALMTGDDPSLAARIGAALKLGSAVHAATLEPHRVVVFGPGEWTDEKGKTKPHKGKRNGGAWDQFRAKQPSDAVIVTPKEHRITSAIASALRDHPEAGPLLYGAGVIREQQILWAHDGRAYSSRPDARIPGVEVTEVKTCRSADPDKFIWDIVRFHYREQLRMYDEADAYEVGEDYRTRTPIPLRIVAVETAPPHVIQVYRLHRSAIMAADRSIAWWREKLRTCESANYWPGYAQGEWEVTDDEPENNPPGSDEDDGDEDMEPL